MLVMKTDTDSREFSSAEHKNLNNDKNKDNDSYSSSSGNNKDNDSYSSSSGNDKKNKGKKKRKKKRNLAVCNPSESSQARSVFWWQSAQLKQYAQTLDNSLMAHILLKDIVYMLC